MATKWKSTGREPGAGGFAGVISWLCMMALILLIAAAIPVAVWLIFDSEAARGLSQTISYVEHLLRGAREDRLLALSPILGTAALFLGAVILTFAFRRDRKAFETDLARMLGKLWVEVKLLLLAGVGALTVALAMEDRIPIRVTAILAMGGALLLYFLCLDISHNRRFFGHNIPHSILVRVTEYKGLPGFSRRSLRRLYACIGVGTGLTILIALILAIRMDRWIDTRQALLMAALLLIACGGTVGVVVWYTVALKQDLRDQEALATQIAEMYGGNLDAVNRVSPASALYDTAMQLNMIRTGIQRAVDEGVKADRTKVELITNVSHDIKTPLTSIISYVELLKKEPGLSEQGKDYVNTISQKADRLSHIVQDVFEVSKAATGNLPLELEELDLGKLLRQTFGEMEESLDSQRFTWRVSIPEEPVMIRADGQRLYRVFQNLIRNCAQYALEGSRIYVNLMVENGWGLVQLRNVSRTELAPGRELTARFVRGDQNRSTEGSGLGLSIAKSFTEACGGRFDLTTEGDVFTVTAAFPTING